MQKILFYSVVVLLVLAGAYVIFGGSGFTDGSNTTASSITNSQINKNMEATINTNQGVMRVELFAHDAPKTVENFMKLAKQGFYNGLSFHRVIPGFMIQGGDPYCGKDGGADVGMCGTGGPSYKFEDELNLVAPSYKDGYKKGVLAMANSGPNTNGSQFFIMVDDVQLPHNYTIFGRVTAGQEVADAISNVKRNSQDRPLESVIIQVVAVSE